MSATISKQPSNNWIYWLMWLAFTAWLLLATSCTLLTGFTKQERKCNRAAKRVEWATNLCPSMKQDPVIIHDTVTVNLPAIKVDTLVIKVDTIEIVKDRWRVRIIDRIDSLYIEGSCDEDSIDVPIKIKCPPQIAPQITIKKALTWWQIALMALGVVTIVKGAIWLFHGYSNRN